MEGWFKKKYAKAQTSGKNKLKDIDDKELDAGDKGLVHVRKGDAGVASRTKDAIGCGDKI